MKEFVLQVQRLLNRLGANPPLVEDGINGVKTATALRDALLARAPKPVVKEDDRPNLNEGGRKLLWHPLAQKLDPMKSQGEYRKKYPEGLIVHFTAGHCETEQDMINSMNWGRSQNLSFMGIGPTGRIYQATPLDRWGSHAGSSSWPTLGSSVSQYLVGVEIASAGKVDSSGKSWFGKTYAADRLRTVKKEANRQAGTYVKYTTEQEEALISLCLWLKANNPQVFDFDLVLGHDEVSPSRKDDPGGSLSMTMPELRAELKRRWAQR